MSIASIIYESQGTWSITKEGRASVAAVIQSALDGHVLQPDAATARPSAIRNGTIGVLPIFGVLTRRTSLFTMLLGGTGYDMIGAQFHQMMNDPNVKAIVLDIDSPGGQMVGVDELSAMIYKARSVKPIVAVANSTMASAAYALGSSAGEVVATSDSLTGSIGTILTHLDLSKAAEQAGVTPTVFSSGKFKAEGHELLPLTDDAKEHIQGMVDGMNDIFVKLVARNRTTSVAAVRAGYGQGRALMAKEAKAANLVDRIGTLDQTLARYGVRRAGVGAGAEAPTVSTMGDLDSSTSGSGGIVYGPFAPAEEETDMDNERERRQRRVSVLGS